MASGISTEAVIAVLALIQAAKVVPILQLLASYSANRSYDFLTYAPPDSLNTL